MLTPLLRDMGVQWEDVAKALLLIDTEDVREAAADPKAFLLELLSRAGCTEFLMPRVLSPYAILCYL